MGIAVLFATLSLMIGITGTSRCRFPLPFIIIASDKGMSNRLARLFLRPTIHSRTSVQKWLYRGTEPKTALVCGGFSRSDKASSLSKAFGIA